MSSSSRALLCLAAMLLVFAGTAPAEDGPVRFGVDSYIPKRFTDLEWQVQGDFNVSGSRSDLDNRSQADGRYRAKDDYDGGTLRMGSQIGYDWVTIPRYLHADLKFSDYLSTSSHDTFRDEADTLANGDYYRGDSRKTSYGVSIGPALSAGQYLVGDLEVAGSITYLYDYDGTLTNEGHVFDSTVLVDAATGWVQTINRETREERDGDSKSHRLTAEFTPGWGRIYEGKFAATAMNMVGELRRAGFLAHEPGYEAMQELTEIVYRYRLKHAVDPRLLRIEALDSIIYYLYDCGALADPGPYAHLVIQDVWDYFDGRRNSRPFGFKVSGGVSADYTGNSNQYGSTRTRSYFNTQYHPDSAGAIDTLLNETTVLMTPYHAKQISSRPAVIARIQYSRPLNLNWLINLTAQGDFYFDAYESYVYDDLTRRTEYDDYYGVSVSARAEYFYDARTSITFAADYDRTNRNEHEWDTREGEPPEVGEFHERSAWELGLQATATYRISVPTTLTANLFWRKKDEDRGSRFDYDRSSYQLSMGVSHYLF